MRRTLWVLPDDSAPLRHVVRAYDEVHGGASTIHWQASAAAEPVYGRTLTLRTSRAGYDLTVKLVDPRLLRAIHRHPAEVVVVLELDLVALYAVVSRWLRRGRRRVVVLVEDDVTQMGPTGSARWKMWFRRQVARGVDAFVANNANATRYLHEEIRVEQARIIEGWWLAGLPDGLEAEPPPAEVMQRGRGPILLSVGQLIPRKGHDLLLRAAAAYTGEVGPCRVWILGTGPDEAALRALAESLGIGGATTFFGHVTHSQLKGAAQAADAFVFPTLGDLVGRALVEVLSVGTPTVVSVHSGAIGTLVKDGRNVIVVDPRDEGDLLRGLKAITDPAQVARLRPGLEATEEQVSVHSAVEILHRGVTG